ncbi:hypothetical protein L210DRAFT_3648458 [Boletus edulis BED1]|uniref:Uncharacterized protein n=1 Tax=Boletus edulis BED1 TaxID=1328754 RepID=A0AAD4GBI7_BOLED|nr:hypothetical protein L210DRAFT_3648458 [Boletus edulis BED1]
MSPAVYKYIFAGLVDPLAILDANPELALQILSETLVSIPVQAFFVHRIYNVSGKNIVVPLLWAIQAIYQIVASILYVASSDVKGLAWAQSPGLGLA